MKQHIFINNTWTQLFERNQWLTDTFHIHLTFYKKTDTKIKINNCSNENNTDYAQSCKVLDY